ncbi:hypothetical protein Ddye_020675 [Dipteronia dyeriana]|uniref:DDE Tnp4 domain-containing protein n=1 Tax=Dipteronia dyeriana TaxID=168575 RepID=A0AAD9WX91_9ROSI|nr:hypothetical protein Ddye_020675 [Dipteronia dyeriana]
MGPETFKNLCEILKRDGGLRPTKLATIEERPIISLEDQFLQQPTGSNVSPKVGSNNWFYPYCKDCVWTIDGTHVRVKVSRDDDQGKYYLVDAGYMLRSGLIELYRGMHYHLKEYSSHPSQNSRELFNLRHASLRNAIERAFGGLKKCFPFIGSTTEPNYSVDMQSSITLACCILYNYLMGVDPDESLIEEVDKEISNEFEESEKVDDAPINVDENCLKFTTILLLLMKTLFKENLSETR